MGEGFSNEKVITFDSKFFDTEFKGHHSPPILYRFYPSAIAWQGLDADDNEYTPFRLIAINTDTMVADSNHPLAKYFLNLTATVVDSSKIEAIGNRPRRNISKLLTSKGPGMQTPFEFGDPVFFDNYPFELSKRNNAAGTNTRLALQIAKLHTELIPDYSKVLDLMSNKKSYFEDNFKTGLLVGLGKDESELIANQRLDTYSIQDLNEETSLSFETDHFDAAICTLSIDYLSDPLAVYQEIARVVKSGGKFIITFSEQQTSAASITLWAQLHPFERMQLVLTYFQESRVV